MDNYMPHEQYRKYLTSNEWKKKRRAAIKAAGKRCAACGFVDGPYCRELAVHHKTYEHIGAEPIEDLEVLCKPCHEKYHLMHGGQVDGQSAAEGLPKTTITKAAAATRDYYDRHPDESLVLPLSEIVRVFRFSHADAMAVVEILLASDRFGIAPVAKVQS